MLILANGLYIYNPEHPKECILFVALYMELLFFLFSNFYNHPGLHPNKSKASHLDIELGYSVTYVNIGQLSI